MSIEILPIIEWSPGTGDVPVTIQPEQMSPQGDTETP